MPYFFLLVLLLTSGVRCLAQDRFALPGFRSESATVDPAELKEMLQNLCPGQEFIGKESGCHVCPQETGWAGQADGLTVASVLRGHFLGADSDDVLLQTSGCEPHVTLFGGDVVFSRSPTGWRIGRGYHPGPAGYCRPVKSSSGLDGLLCWQEDGHFDGISGGLYFHYETNRDGRVQLMGASDNGFSACFAVERGSPVIIVQTKIEKMALQQDSGGELSLVIRANCRRGPLSQQAEAACRRDLNAEVGPEQPFRTFQMVYRFDGQTFSLTPSSEADAHEYGACAAFPQ